MCTRSASALIDCSTPQDVQTLVGHDGRDYKLVFSDEFEQAGRTFKEGDDPFWTAADMHYYATGDLEYYDPSRITTKDGHLVIEMIKVDDPESNHGFDYASGMLTSWNQFCFTGGILQASVSLPGSPDVTGFWPGFWTLGNLGRPSYGATNDGTWPYTYNTCDSGTLVNQTNIKAGKKAPMVVLDGVEAQLSSLPGQKLSACTCAGEDHPGPSNDVGRGAPELDVFEALVNEKELYGEISQSLQLAPFDADYQFKNTTANYMVDDKFETHLNEWRGGPYQQCISGLSKTDQKSYCLVDHDSFQTYGFEYAASNGKNTDGYITWTQGDTSTLHLHEEALSGNADLDIGQRLISREPMYIIMNLGMSEGFNKIDLEKLKFPATMRFDWVRVYQPVGYENIDCDPPGFPTAEYIKKHEKPYTDSKIKKWSDYLPEGFPKNSLTDQC